MEALLRLYKRGSRFVKICVKSWSTWAKDVAKKGAITLLVCLFLFWISIFLYGSFYYAYMPTIFHINPVFFQHDKTCQERRDIADCPFPSANLSLVLHPNERLFMRGQPYRVQLQLEMPHSPMNENIGIFMVKLEMYAENGVVISQTLRPTMLHYKSTLLKVMETLSFAPFLILGYTEEKQFINVDLHERYLDNAYKPAIGAYVELLARNVEVYSSFLKVQTYFTGLRYFMFNWPITSALFGIGSNFIILVFVAFLSWFQFLWGNEITEPIIVEMEYKPQPPKGSVLKQQKSTRASKSGPSVTTLYGGSDDNDEGSSSPATALPGSTSADADKTKTSSSESSLNSSDSSSAFEQVESGDMFGEGDRSRGYGESVQRKGDTPIRYRSAHSAK